MIICRKITEFQILNVWCFKGNEFVDAAHLHKVYKTFARFSFHYLKYLEKTAMQDRYVDLDMPEHEKLVSCPLNKAHQVVKHRMAKHLVKCRRTHSTAGLKECRFNSTHLVPEADFVVKSKCAEGF